LRLYRKWLLFGKKWPFQANRQGKNLHERILATAKTNFRLNKSLDSSMKQKAIDKAELDLKDFRELKANKFRDMYPIRDVTLPEIAKRAKELLATNYRNQKYFIRIRSLWAALVSRKA